MRLEEFEQTGTEERPRFVMRVEDAAGQDGYELIVTGPPDLVNIALGEADFDVSIDSSATQERAVDEVRAIENDNERAAWELAALTSDADIFKEAPEPLDTQRSVLTSLRRTRGSGTYYQATYANLGPLPSGVNLLAFVPPSLVVGGVVAPRSGDQDLYFYLGSNLQPVRSSTRPGALVDALSLVTATSIYPYMLWRVLWFTGGVCGFFRYAGYAGTIDF